MSPTEIALAALRKDGWTVAVVEKWIAAIKQRKDMGGFADILAWRGTIPGPMPGPGRERTILAVQVTSDNGGHLADHRTKLNGVPGAAEWVRAGGVLEIWGTSTRRPNAAYCETCEGVRLVVRGEEGGHKKCPACKGTGKGKRPLTKRHFIRRERAIVEGESIRWEPVE